MTTDRTPALLPVTALSHWLDRPDVAVVDCRHDLGQPTWGEQAWTQGHIPGAVFAHLDRDLSGPLTPASGRHPLPDRARLAQCLGRIGIGPATHVVAYDQGRSAFAARLWWLLRWLGHEAVSVLDGGLAAWQAAGLPLATSVPPRPGASLPVRQPLVADIGSADLQAALARGAVLLLDARGADRFAGRNETIDPVAGHVPGARNHPFSANFTPDGLMLPAPQLARHWRAQLGGREPADVVSMCGSGVTACANLLALHAAGLHGAKLYGGSWSEWIRDPQRPVATGPA